MVVGTNSLTSGGKSYSVNKIIVHENYDGNEIVNDVSVIKVSGRIEFNNRVQPIKLPGSNTPGGAKVTLTGWGRLSVSIIVICHGKICYMPTLCYMRFTEVME